MYKDLKRNFYWKGIKRSIATYVSQCLTCQQVKAKHQKPPGLLQPLLVPQWKWEHISMDFVVGLPRSQQGHDAVWVIVDQLTKTAYFITYSITYSVERLSQLYIQHIVRLHGVLVTIVSDRDSYFTVEFWRSLQAALGTSLNLSSAFHLQTNG